MPFATGLALALSAVINTAQVPASTPIAPMPAVQTVQQYVETYFADTPVMIKIAGCESHFKQFDKTGSVVQNPNSTAVGVFQIMSSIHATAADENLGLDIYSLQGNAAYAKYLYEKQGTTPWNSSKGCWSKSDKVATK